LKNSISQVQQGLRVKGEMVTMVGMAGQDFKDCPEKTPWGHEGSMAKTVSQDFRFQGRKACLELWGRKASGVKMGKTLGHSQFHRSLLRLNLLQLRQVT
jgi:hypothetical protein